MSDRGTTKVGSRKIRSGVIFGAVFIAFALFILIYGLIGASSKLQNVCYIEDIMKESEKRTWRTVYFDITEEPIFVGSDEDMYFYLIYGDGNYHIARMTESEYAHVSNEVSQNGKMHFTAVTRYLGASDLKAEIAENCDDMFHVGVTGDDLQMYVGDVYLKYAELDYGTVLTEIYPANLVFGGLFLIIGFIVLGCNYHPKKKKTYKPAVISETYTYTYKGKWAWENAAKEYRRLKGISEDVELSEEETYKIYDYTVTPLSYFYGWLCEKNLLGEGFVNEFGEDAALDIINRVKTGVSTPLDVLGEFDCYFSYEWIKSEAREFFRVYFDSRNIFNDKNCYIYDYYECNGEPVDRYYCMEYSLEIQKKMNQRLDERYYEYNNKNPRVYNSSDYYEDYDDEDNIVNVHSDYFDTDLEVYRFGRKIKGEFPEDYALKCVQSFSQMSQEQWNRMKRWLMEFYDVNAEEISVNHFHPYDIYIFEPQSEGDLAFIINGGSDYEEEHGISFTIRNGVLLDWSYAGESHEPYDEEMIERYERFTCGIDYESIDTEDVLDKLVAEGKLVRTVLLPEYLGGEDTDSNKSYVTVDALAKLQNIHRKLKMLKAYAASELPDWEFHVDVIVNYSEEPDVLLPMWITFSTPWRKQAISISLRADIWE
ncbi:MAG: hypothetical protein ILA13_09115 [Eubacterium sp.]|nr:hypothetical protein [Eubacterium sp.]